MAQLRNGLPQVAKEIFAPVAQDPRDEVIAQLMAKIADMQANQAAPVAVEHPRRANALMNLAKARAARAAKHNGLTKIQPAKVVTGFAYQGKNPDATLGSLDAKEQRQKAFTLAGYGLAFDANMTKFEYAKACADKKSSGVKWRFPKRETAPAAPVAPALTVQDRLAPNLRERLAQIIAQIG